MRSTYPLASQTRQPRPHLAGGGTFDHVEKLVLHTTETAGWPGYPTFAPHLTYDPWKHQMNQHFSLEKSATTLVDGGSTKVRENRDFAIQLEIVAYSDQKMAAKYGHNINDIDDQAVRELADLLAWLHKTAGLELRLTPGWLPYPQSYGNTKNRMSGPEYDAFRGVLGHEHVSTNVHGDPGDPPWLDRMLAYAKTAAGQPSTTPAPTTGKGLDMADAKDIYFQPKTPAAQPIKAGLTTLDLGAVANPKDPTYSVVVGPSDGVDVGATVLVLNADGTAYDGPVLKFFRVVSYKKGTDTTTYSDRKATADENVFFKGALPKLDGGRSARLRLVVQVPSDAPAGLTAAVEVSGWAL